MKRLSKFDPEILFTPHLRIENIMAKVRFFEDDTTDENIKFCNGFNITYLPSRDGKSVYLFNETENSFKKQDLDQLQKVALDEAIFSSELRIKFKEKIVLFVFKDDEIVGVLHFSDYNSPIVYVYLYSKIMLLEESLRRFLGQNKVTNEDVIEYFHEKLKTCSDNTAYYCSRISEFKKQKEKIKELKMFQIFQLTDLIHYSNSILSLGIDPNKISDLRNNVMHFKMLVRYETTDNEDNDSGYVYDYKTFQKLIGNLEYLDSLLKMKLMKRIVE